VKELQQHPIRYTLAMFDVEYIACFGFDELKQDTAKQRSMNIEVYYKLISRFGSVGDDNNLREKNIVVKWKRNGGQIDFKLFL
jgi:hypothetical protein